MLYILQLDTSRMGWLTCKCSSTWLPGNPAENQASHPLADEQIGSVPGTTAEDFPFWDLYPTFKLD